MANAVSSNTIYIDTTGTVADTSNIKVDSIVFTSTGANAEIAIRDAQSPAVDLLNIREATADKTVPINFIGRPLNISAGVDVTVTNAIVTLVYRKN